jgi:hypothetical protein
MTTRKALPSRVNETVAAPKEAARDRTGECSVKGDGEDASGDCGCCGMSGRSGKLRVGLLVVAFVVVVVLLVRGFAAAG